jgi:hypothetical protein
MSGVNRVTGDAKPGPKPEDLSGIRFGKTVAVEYTYRMVGSVLRGHWICRCDCGNLHTVSAGNLKSGRTTQCTECAHTKHGAARRTGYRPEYRVWSTMRQRCLNPDSPNYANYGGRGISVDKSWDRFEQFIQDVGPRPGPGYELDRIDNDGPYAPWNCRWVTRSVNASNKHRRNAVLPHEYIMGALSCPG